MSWLQLMCLLLHKPLPEAHEGLEPAGQPVEVEERKRWPWWKVKKWACVIVTRFSQRYGMPRYVPDQHRAFAKQFYEKVGGRPTDSQPRLHGRPASPSPPSKPQGD